MRWWRKKIRISSNPTHQETVIMLGNMGTMPAFIIWYDLIGLHQQNSMRPQKSGHEVNNCPHHISRNQRPRIIPLSDSSSLSQLLGKAMCCRIMHRAAVVQEKIMDDSMVSQLFSLKNGSEKWEIIKHTLVIPLLLIKIRIPTFRIWLIKQNAGLYHGNFLFYQKLGEAH